MHRQSRSPGMIKKLRPLMLLAAFLAAAVIAAHGVPVFAAGIDINSANFEKLLEIDGVNEVTAAKIIKYRRENGGFKTIYDLMKVDGVSGELFEKIKDSISAGAAVPRGGAKPPAGTVRPPSSPGGAEEDDGGEAGDEGPAVEPGRPVRSAASDRMADPDETGGTPAVSGAGEQGGRETAPARAGGGRIASEDEDGAEASAQPANAGEAARDNDYSFEEGRKASAAKRPAGGVSGGSRGARIGDDIKKIALTPENYYKVIIGLMRLAKYEKAESNIADFIRKFPSDRRVDDMNYLMGACFEEAEKYKEAIETYEKVYENQNSELRALALFRIGVCCDLMGRSADALDNYRKYVSSFPSSSCVKEAEGRIEEMLKTK